MRRAVGKVAVAIMRSSVVLPEPLWPVSNNDRPSGNVYVRRETAQRVPNRLLTSAISRALPTRAAALFRAVSPVEEE